MSNMISYTDPLGNVINYEYDDFNRVKRSFTRRRFRAGCGWMKYAFDDVGNRTTSHLSATHGYQSGKFNQLTSTATADYEFDANGNTIRRSEGSNFWRCTWDFENRLTEASTRKEKASITRRALAGPASSYQTNLMADEQYKFDSETQDPAYAPQHAMARPGQSPEDARREANIFVRNRICTARRLFANGNEADAMRYLGQAMHTMQDAASPEHHGFQPAWPNTFFEKLWQAGPFGHYRGELFDPGSGSAADRNTRRAWDYFSGNSPMPSDYFDNAYDTRRGIRYTPYVNRNPKPGENCGC